jgi:predicted extracellular nuclease
MDAQDALYAPDQYRSSDHDAVIVGLRLGRKPPKVKG